MDISGLSNKHMSSLLILSMLHDHKSAAVNPVDKITAISTSAKAGDQRQSDVFKSSSSGSAVAAGAGATPEDLARSADPNVDHIAEARQPDGSLKITDKNLIGVVNQLANKVRHGEIGADDALVPDGMRDVIAKTAMSKAESQPGMTNFKTRDLAMQYAYRAAEQLVGANKRGNHEQQLKNYYGDNIHTNVEFQRRQERESLNALSEGFSASSSFIENADRTRTMKGFDVRHEKYGLLMRVSDEGKITMFEAGKELSAKDYVENVGDKRAGSFMSDVAGGRLDARYQGLAGIYDDGSTAQKLNIRV